MSEHTPPGAPRFKIGTVYTRPRSRCSTVCTVIDIHTTTNAAGETVCVKYVVSYDWLGPRTSDVCETEIASCLAATT